MSNNETKKQILLFSGKICFFDHGLRINKFKTSATNVRARSIIKGIMYAPDASKTVLDAVAIKEPTITVKVISAILPEKCLSPKKVDVNAAVIVGQEP